MNTQNVQYMLQLANQSILAFWEEGLSKKQNVIRGFQTDWEWRCCNNVNFFAKFYSRTINKQRSAFKLSSSLRLLFQTFVMA